MVLPLVVGIQGQEAVAAAPAPVSSSRAGGRTATILLESGLELPVGGNYHHPDPGAEFGVEGDCVTGPYEPRSGENDGRVNAVTTKGTAFPDDQYTHYGIIAEVPLPGDHAFLGVAIRVPRATMKATPRGSFIELVESSPTDGTVPDPRPVSIRLYHGGRLGLATFMKAEPVVKSTFKIIPDTWFYTVLEVAYGSAVPLSLAIYDQNDALVETLSGTFDTTGGLNAGARQKLGGETTLGAWPDEFYIYYDDWYIASESLGPLRIG